MSKSNNHSKLLCLKEWFEQQKRRGYKIPTKPSRWDKEIDSNQEYLIKKFY